MDLFDSLTPESLVERQSEILDAVSNGNVRAKIPLISNLENFDQLNDGQLVRFRGLVQNMYDPEIYLEQYQVKDAENAVHTRTGKYRDNLKLKVKRNDIERSVLQSISACKMASSIHFVSISDK